MAAHALDVPELVQQGAQPLVRLSVGGGEAQRRLIVRAGGAELVRVHQKIGQVHMGRRLVRVVRDRLHEDGAGGGGEAGLGEQGPEVVQAPEVGRVPPQGLQILGLGRLGAAEPGQQQAAFGQQVEARRPGLELGLDRGQSRFP